MSKKRIQLSTPYNHFIYKNRQSYKQRKTIGLIDKAQLQKRKTRTNEFLQKHNDGVYNYRAKSIGHFQKKNKQ